MVGGKEGGEFRRGKEEILRGEKEGWRKGRSGILKITKGKKGGR